MRTAPGSPGGAAVAGPRDPGHGGRLGGRSRRPLRRSAAPRTLSAQLKAGSPGAGQRYATVVLTNTSGAHLHGRRVRRAGPARCAAARACRPTSAGSRHRRRRR